MLFEKSNNKKLNEWLKKDEREQEKIAIKYGYSWFFDWFETGDILRYKYEQADKDPRVKEKYIECYDNYYKKQIKKQSDFNPNNTWIEYTPCTNNKCIFYSPIKWKDGGNCSYFGDNIRIGYDCFNELFAQIQQWIDICGIETLDELQKDLKIHDDIIGWFKEGDSYFNR